MDENKTQNPDLQAEILSYLKKQTASTEAIQNLLAKELARQKTWRWLKFTYHLIIARVIAASLGLSYFFISGPLKAMREFTEKINNKTSNLENMTKSGLNTINEGLNKLNPFGD